MKWNEKKKKKERTEKTKIKKIMCEYTWARAPSTIVRSSYHSKCVDFVFILFFVLRLFIVLPSFVISVCVYAQIHQKFINFHFFLFNLFFSPMNKKNVRGSVRSVGAHCAFEKIHVEIPSIHFVDAHSQRWKMLFSHLVSGNVKMRPAHAAIPLTLISKLMLFWVYACHRR